MPKKRLKPKGYTRLNQTEKEALLIAMLNHYKPGPAVINELSELREEIERLSSKGSSDTGKYRVYEYNMKEILQTAFSKLNQYNHYPLVSSPEKFEDTDYFLGSLLSLSRNASFSLGSKGIVAYAMVQLYINNGNWPSDPKQLKEALYEVTNEIELDENFDGKNDVECALEQIYGYDPSNNKINEQNIALSRELQEFSVSSFLEVAEDTSISWEAKGVYLYTNLYKSINPREISEMCSAGNIIEAVDELISEDYINTSAK